MLNDISYFCAVGIRWSIYWFLREPVELAEKQTFPPREWLVLFSVVCVFLFLLLFFQSKQHSYGNMFWYKDSTRPKYQECCECKLFFFQILHKLSNYAGRWPFPRMGMIPLGGNILYWQGNLLSLYTFITEEQNLPSMQQNNTWMPEATTGVPTHDKVMRKRTVKQGFRIQRTP